MKSKRILSALLALVMIFALYSCTAEKAETETTEPASGSPGTSPGTYPVETDAVVMTPKYTESERTPADFATELLRLSYNSENTLVSPLSVAMALAMVSEGAEGNTATQFAELFGGMSADEVNEYFREYMDSVDPTVLDLANSAWIKDGFPVKDSFTDALRSFYSADSFSRPFDTSTVEEINKWTEENTDGMIEKIIEELDPWTVMVLVNTVLFEAEWSEKYDEDHVRDGEFTTRDGEKKTVTMMSSTEHTYLENELSTGVMKPYKRGKGKYAFAALLPKEGVTIDELIDSLDGKMITDTLSSASEGKVITRIPQFEYDFGVDLSDILQKMGISDAFNRYAADFTGISDSAKKDQLHINKVIHKTKIELSPVGTKAGAATAVVLWAGSAFDPNKPKEVYLDRPFVYMIVDTETDLPIFIGAVTDIGE